MPGVIYTVFVYRLAQDPTQSVVHEQVYPNSGRRVQIQRCWGWFPDKDVAHHCIMENCTDIFEDGYYDHAFIEEVREGVLASAQIIGHYMFVRPSIGPAEVIMLKDPPSPLFKHTSNWSLG